MQACADESAAPRAFARRGGTSQANFALLIQGCSCPLSYWCGPCPPCRGAVLHGHRAGRGARRPWSCFRPAASATRRSSSRPRHRGLPRPALRRPAARLGRPSPAWPLSVCGTGRRRSSRVRPLAVRKLRFLRVTRGCRSKHTPVPEEVLGVYLVEQMRLLGWSGQGPDALPRGHPTSRALFPPAANAVEPRVICSTLGRGCWVLGCVPPNKGGNRAPAWSLPLTLPSRPSVGAWMRAVP